METGPQVINETQADTATDKAQAGQAQAGALGNAVDEKTKSAQFEAYQAEREAAAARRTAFDALTTDTNGLPVTRFSLAVEYIHYSMGLPCKYTPEEIVNIQEHVGEIYIMSASMVLASGRF